MTAVEFGIIAVPFFAIIFAILETAIMLLSTQVLENAVEVATRQLYTGEFQNGNTDTTDPNELARRFRERVFCKRTVLFANCGTVLIDVRVVTSYSPNLPSPIRSDRTLDPAFGSTFVSPGKDKIVVVRAAIQVPVFASLLNPNQANLANGKRLVVGTAAFRTEPF